MPWRTSAGRSETPGPRPEASPELVGEMFADPFAALTILGEALAMAQSAGDSDTVVDCLCYLSSVDVVLGRLGDAVHAAQRRAPAIGQLRSRPDVGYRPRQLPFVAIGRCRTG